MNNGKKMYLLFVTLVCKIFMCVEWTEFSFQVQISALKGRILFVMA